MDRTRKKLLRLAYQRAKESDKILTKLLDIYFKRGVPRNNTVAFDELTYQRILEALHEGKLDFEQADHWMKLLTTKIEIEELRSIQDQLDKLEGKT